jgi:hypothetical protein
LWYTRGNDTLSSYINLDVLFFKIKEYTRKSGLNIWSGFKGDFWNAEVRDGNVILDYKKFEGTTEIESVIKALVYCEGIIEVLESDLV